MVDWNSPAEIAKDAVAFDKSTQFIFGLYVWECLVSFGFDWQFITGKKPFRWPMTFYFLNKYSLLLGVMGVVISLNVKTHEIDCQALYVFNALVGTSAVGFASINLSIRTMAVWSRRWYIVAPLVVLILGHWSLILHGVVLKAIWVPGQGCVIVSTNTTIMLATWIYSMTFDFIIMLLTAIKLLGRGSGFRSKLMVMIFKDGLIYFIVAFLGNVMTCVLLLLNLNAVMSIIGVIPAVTISTIAACRVVRRLNNFTFSEMELLPISQGPSGALGLGSQTTFPTKAGKLGVHVQMETFQHPVSENKTLVGFDSAGQLSVNDSYDPESQKRPPF